MSRTGRLRNEIAQYLEDNGVSNTSQILEHINKRFRWGATMNQVGNLVHCSAPAEALVDVLENLTSV